MTMMQLFEGFVYESKVRVARVATGFALLIRRENLVDFALTMISRATKTMMYVGKANLSHVFQ